MSCGEQLSVGADISFCYAFQSYTVEKDSSKLFINKWISYPIRNTYICEGSWKILTNVSLTEEQFVFLKCLHSAAGEKQKKMKAIISVNSGINLNLQFICTGTSAEFPFPKIKILTFMC